MFPGGILHGSIASKGKYTATPESPYNGQTVRIPFADIQSLYT